MKYAIVIIDGAADVPLKELGEKTPLQAAYKPNLDRLTASGLCGMVKTVPDGMPPGSDVAIMSLLGNDPVQCYSGRAPIEAAARGITLASDEWAFRCNLVTILGGRMKDHSSGNISSAEGEELMKAVQKELGSAVAKFASGVSYRNLMIYKGAFDGTTTPPHDILDRPAAEYLPTGEGSALLRDLVARSQTFLSAHPVNKERVRKGLNPATSIWFWGQGRAPKIGNFKAKYGLTGAMVAAVDLSRGIAKLMGWDNIDVPGATGYFDTNYAGKGDAAIKALATHDIVCVHIEAPDEAGHAGKIDEKVSAIEKIDAQIIGPLAKAMAATSGGWRMLVQPDHPTPCTIRTHVGDPVPFTVAGTGVSHNGASMYSEATAQATGLFIPKGADMIDFLVNRAK